MNYNLQGFKELQYGDWQLDLQRTTTWWTTNATYWIWYGLNDLHRISSEDIKTGSLNIKIKFCGIHGEKSTWIHQFYCCLYPQFYNWNLEEISLSIKSFISMVLLFIALIFFDWSKIEGVLCYMVAYCVSLRFVHLNAAFFHAENTDNILENYRSPDTA